MTHSPKADHNKWGSQFWLRNAARTSMRCARAAPFSTPVVSQLIISNRHTCRLEMPETYRKQTTAPLSNRHKFTHSHRTSLPTWSPIKHNNCKLAEGSFAALPSHGALRAGRMTGLWEARRAGMKGTQAGSPMLLPGRAWALWDGYGEGRGRTAR